MYTLSLIHHKLYHSGGRTAFPCATTWRKKWFANPFTIYSYAYPNPYYGCYGIEFSPDGSKLYAASAAMGSVNPGDIGRVFQFDLKSHEPENILASAVLLNVPDFASYFGSLQLGPNGKIYVVRLSQLYLGVIQNPNAAGTACQYKKEGVNLGEGLLLRLT